MTEKNLKKWHACCYVLVTCFLLAISGTETIHVTCINFNKYVDMHAYRNFSHESSGKVHAWYMKHA